MEYEAVIGLEVHVQLKTASKMFTRSPYRFAEPPNTQTDAVILALPGVLPVMNKEALNKSIKVGLLLGCTIPEVCKWDRKNYWYPDSPKNYQLTQYDQPICLGGTVEIEMPGPSRNVMGAHRRVQLTRIHLEEDVGKLTHFEKDSLVDLNRAGVPLLEIVTEPDMHNGDECFAFLTALRMILTQAGLSDCDMEKGQMRCDANISVRPVGESKLGTKVELKNLNTITGVRNGVEYEIKRQSALCREGRRHEIVQETRRWNADQGYTTTMRGKEKAHDYRYFPDPDLMPLRIDAAWRTRMQEGLPELPFDRQRRYQEAFGLPYTLTSVLVPDRELSEFFEAAVALCGKPREVANFIANDLLRELTAAGKAADADEASALAALGGAYGSGETHNAVGSGPLPLNQCKLTPNHIAELVKLVDESIISSQIAREVFNECFQTGEMPQSLVDRKGLRQSNDTGEIERLCAEAIAGNPKAVAEYKAGSEKAINALKGPVMKATKGKGNPKVIDDVLRKLLG
ncbi:MAG: Asp-tRNA(Asn)/Glu-tRNA(Gln) amidotransferase subunit GatB [Verrucomicrobiota bacterium]|nr:Asp-tRNA(Asn)/Glu-tRNA(Gln) amidotransferase subunit GatB [Verrucomicrobiota bacterium]